MSNIKQKVARSSLGTASAVAARRSVTDAQTSQVIARAKALRQVSGTGGKQVGGNR